MITLIARLGAGLAFLAPLAAQQPTFAQVLAKFVEQAPLSLEYSYNLTGSDFHREIKGTIYLAEPAVFRLELDDKVYAATDDLLYLHDLNTHQTVIDSLRWSELQPWVRLLNGELPTGTEVTSRDVNGKQPRFIIRPPREEWTAEATLDSLSGLISTITIDDGVSELDHRIDLTIPESWVPASRDTFFTLLDLPGVRLDLR
ncbi:MAG: hypothetical protein V3W14_12705 [Candidatus Neomarinimicrobiota bacterium]